MAQDITVDKSKFDSLLRKMLETSPLPKSQVRVAKPKPKKKTPPEGGAKIAS
jgi:hypothetical protein